MTPPPIMTIDSGIFYKLRAPVELITIFSSNGSPGKAIGSLPVANITFLVVIVSLVPSFLVTDIVFWSYKLPCPVI